jgi:hypothetical protein
MTAPLSRLSTALRSCCGTVVPGTRTADDRYRARRRSSGHDREFEHGGRPTVVWTGELQSATESADTPVDQPQSEALVVLQLCLTAGLQRRARLALCMQCQLNELPSIW